MDMRDTKDKSVTREGWKECPTDNSAPVQAQLFLWNNGDPY